MVDVDTLETVGQPGYLRQSAVLKRPVGQQFGQGGEDVEGVATAGIGLEERRDEDVAAVLAYLGTRAGTGGGIAPLHLGDEGAEAVERLRAVAAVGIADALEGRADGDGRHVERTAVGCRRALVHELYGLCFIIGTRGVDVDLQVALRFHGGTYLQVLGSRARRGRRHGFVHQQPVVLLGLVDIAVVCESEGEVQTRRQDVARTLSEGVADVRHEARQGHRPLPAVRDVHRAHGHQQTGHLLGGVVPPLLVERFLRQHAELQLDWFRGGRGDVALLFGNLVDRILSERVGNS